MTTIASRLQAVRRRIESAAVAAGRMPGDIQLIAVSKTFSAQAIYEAVHAGQTAFGENYLQEALEKIAALEAIPGGLNVAQAEGIAKALTRPASSRQASQWAQAEGPQIRSSERDCTAATDKGRDFSSRARHSAGVASPQAGPLLRAPELRVASDSEVTNGSSSDARHSAGVASPQAGPLLHPLEWHFIGPIQSNKTRLIAENFSWVHSVDRLKIAQRLSDARPTDRAPLNICLQVNISAEASKSGVLPEDALPLALEIAKLQRLRLRGLMAVPEPTQDHKFQRHRFAAVRALCERIVAQGLSLDSLSMGMSDDLESAIAEGATLVRVGSAIFGERATQAPR